MINQILFANKTVTDIQRAKKFYLDKLGFTLVLETSLPGRNRGLL